MIVVDGKLRVGAVANGDLSRSGDIDVATYDLINGKVQRATLHKKFQADDHDSPAFLVRPNGPILAMYCKHESENRIHYRKDRDARIPVKVAGIEKKTFGTWCGSAENTSRLSF